MSDEKKIEERSKPEATNDTQAEKISQPKPQPTSNMETHAHHLHKAPGKNFWHYFFEFFMLFFAVFCGFLAEYRLEHKIEKDRERQYMKTLVEDLKADTASFRQIKNWYEFMRTRKDSVVTNLRPPIAKDKVVNYYNEVINYINFSVFTFHDRTIQQLKSSGGFRLIQSEKVSDSLSEYDSRLRGLFAGNNQIIEENRRDIRKLMAQIIDESVFFYTKFRRGERSLFDLEGIEKNKRISLALITDDHLILMNFYNRCLAQLGYMGNQLTLIERMSLRAENLITLILEEYHLK